MDSPRLSNEKLPVLAKSVPKGIAIGLLPCGLLIGLRYTLHSIFQLRFGFSRVTDYDFLLPAPIAYFLLIYLLEEGETLCLKLQTAFLAGCLGSVGVFLTLNAYFEAYAWRSPQLYVGAWFFFLFTAILCAGFAFVSPNYLLRNRNRFAVLPCLLIACSVALYTSYVQTPWSPFASFASTILKAISSCLGSQVTAWLGEEGYLKISHPKLLLRVGQGCGGMESLFYFSILYAIYFSLRGKRLSAIQWFLSYALGMAGMYCLNIVRILFLFFIGIQLRTEFGVRTGTMILKNLFHTNTGWILYSLGCYFFFSRLGAWSFNVAAQRTVREIEAEMMAAASSAWKKAIL